MKVNLKIKKDNTVETVQHEVESIDFLQFTSTLKSISNIMSILDKNEALKQTFEDMFSAGNMDNELTASYVITRAAGAFEAVLIHLPEEGRRLLATLSGIDLKTLEKQDLLDVFDIYDAVIEVNDIEKIFKRAKKSFAVTKSATKFMRKSREATATPAQA